MDNIVLSTFKSYFRKDEKYENITILSNTAAIIFQLFPNINWVGFYLNIDNILQLGPFQGKPACMKIDFNKGVCGYCARTQESIIVPNVHEFQGHIACDIESNSELVIPIVIDDKLYGILDIDSPLINRFNQNDLEMFKLLISYLIELLK